jgi:hypothetical protein
LIFGFEGRDFLEGFRVILREDVFELLDARFKIRNLLFNDFEYFFWQGALQRIVLLLKSSDLVG